MQQKKRFLETANENVALAMSCVPGCPELVDLSAEHIAVTEIGDRITMTQEDGIEEYIREHFLKYRGIRGVYGYPIGSVISGNIMSNEIPTISKFFYKARANASCTLETRPVGQYLRILHRGAYHLSLKTLAIATDYMRNHALIQNGNIYEYDSLVFFGSNNEDESGCLFYIPVKSLM